MNILDNISEYKDVKNMSKADSQAKNILNKLKNTKIKEKNNKRVRCAKKKYNRYIRVKQKDIKFSIKSL